MSTDSDSKTPTGLKPGLGANTAPRPPGKRLVVLTLQGPGSRAFKLHKDRIVIGSVVSADVRLVGEGISPIHAVIEAGRDEDGNRAPPTVYDLASDTGVFVNGAKAVAQELKQGDKITVGRFTLAFGLEDVARISPEERVRESEGRKLFQNPKEDLAPLLLEDEGGREEIFDYRSTARAALEVVMSWRGTILDIEHFVTERTVTIGNAPRTDFALPPLLSTSRYAIVTRQDDTFTLNLDSQMKGVIQRQGRIQTLDELRATMARSSTGYSVPLNRDEFAKVSVGEVDFYFSYASAPPRLRRRKLLERDPLFFQILGSSLVFTGVVIFALLKAHVPQTLEAEQLPDRITTVLYQPEKYVPKPKPKPEPAEPVQAKPPKETPPPKPTPKESVKLDIQPKAPSTPKPVPKYMDAAKTQAGKRPGPKPVAQGGGRAENQAKEGKGARAKGDEGTRGSPKAAPGAQPQTAARRPSPQGGTGRGAGNSQVPDAGNVDLLKGASARIQNLLGNSAAQLGKGGERLSGFGGFTTQGKEGLALSGDGRGGGGTAESLGGLADSGRGGGRVGTGQGAAGSGTGIVGGRARVAIRTGGPEEAVVMGAIDADAVEAALLAHKDEFRLCYEKEINAETPNLSGRVGTSFVIGSSGRVTQAGIESSSLRNANVERCVLNVIRRIDFPIPRGGGIVQVTYPFKFNPVGK